MAKYTSGSTLPGVTRAQMLACQLRFDGEPIEKIAYMCVNCTDGKGHIDEEKHKKAIALVKRWYRNPNVINAYREIMREFMSDITGNAIRALADQVKDAAKESGWLRNKAANDILNRTFNMIFGEEERTIKVQIEGMPALGTPEDESDGNDSDTV